MTLHPDRHDHAQAAAFDAAREKESEYNKNLLDYWVYCTAVDIFMADDLDQDTAVLLAKSLLESVITFAHLPLEERRDKVDAFERQRTAQEWVRVTKKQAVSVKGE